MATVTLEFAGQVGVEPRLVRLFAEEYTRAQVQAAGFLNPILQSMGQQVDVSDFVFAACKDGNFMFTPSFVGSGPIALKNVLSNSIRTGVSTTAGASASLSFTAPCTSSSVVFANWNTQTTPASILTVTPGNGSFTVVSSAAPGSSNLSWMVVTVSL